MAVNQSHKFLLLRYSALICLAWFFLSSIQQSCFSSLEANNEKVLLEKEIGEKEKKSQGDILEILFGGSAFFAKSTILEEAFPNTTVQMLQGLYALKTVPKYLLYHSFKLDC